MRGRFVHGVAAATAALALLVPAGPAIAQTTNPFSPGLPSSPATVPTQTQTVAPIQTTTTAGSSSLSGAGAALIGVGALVVLAGIGFFIWRDARKHAPVRHRPATASPGVPGSGKSGSKTRAKPRKLSPAERRRRKRGRAR